MIEGLTPVVVDNHGGLVTSIERGDLDNGLAAIATNCEFFPGGVKSRGPFFGYLHSTGGGSLAASPVTSILSFPHFDGHKERLYLHANGTLDTEYPEGTCTVIETDLGTDSTVMRGCVFNNKAFMAFSDGRTPGTRPRWWNGTWFDPVSQDGPFGVNTVSGPTVVSSGVTGNATASAIGARQFSLSYETRGGYVTRPTTSDTVDVAIVANEGYKANTLPQPPSNVVKTRLNLTTNMGGEFYSTPALVQSPPNDGDYTFPYSATVGGMSDTELAAAGAAFTITHARQNTWPLPQCLGLETYNSRLVAWGASNYIPNLLVSAVYGTSVAPLVLNNTLGMPNAAFCGGLRGGNAATPVAWFWTGTVAWGEGGAIVERDVAPGVTMCGWRMTGDGATVVRGALQQERVLDRQFAYPTSAAYRVRIRAKKTAGLVDGSLNFELYAATPATSVQITNAELTTEWQWFDFPFIAAGVDASGFPRISMAIGAGDDDFPTNGESITVDEIQIYPTEVPNLNSYLLFSEVNDPETIDYQRGMYGVRPGDGQAIVNVHELRGVLYVFKERSLFAVNDNGNAPYQWDKASLMSDTVGCLSVHGVGRGDGWLATITEAGVFVFSGGQPQKISQEIQPTWNTLNFDYRHKSWCVVDPESQRIYIGVVGQYGTYVDTLFVCDYVSGLDVDPIKSPGEGRKWSVWIPPSYGFPCGARIERDNGQRLFVVGGGIPDTDAFVSSRNPALADYTGGDIVIAGAWGESSDAFASQAPAIMATYETATIGQPEERSFFGYVVAKMHGNGGNVGVELVKPDGSLTTRRERVVATTPLHDLEWQVGVNATQIGLRFTNSTYGVFSMKRSAAYYKKAATSRFRGY